MPSTPNSNNSVSMNDLEEGLAANTSPSPSQNHSSPRSSTATAVTATMPPPSSNHSSSSVAASLRNDHVQTGTTTNQPGAVSEVAAADGTARHGSGSSLHRPSLQVHQATSTQRLAMDEFIQSRSNVTWENLVNSFRPQGRPSRLPTGAATGLEVAPASAQAAATSVTAPRADTATTNNVQSGLELVDDAEGLPLPMSMMEEGLASEEGSAANSSNDKDHSNGTSSIIMKVQWHQEASHGHLSLSSSSAGSTPSGLEVMDGNDGLPLPVGMSEGRDHDEGKKREGVEIIDDGVGPAPPAALIEEMNAKPDLANNLSPPTPFNPVSLENVDAEEKKKASMPSDVDSIIVPTREEIEDDDQFGNNIVSASRWDIGGNEQTPAEDNEGDVESNRLVDENTGGANGDVTDPDLEQNNTAEPDLGGDRETQIITEAYPVEERSDDGIVIVGQPLLPWWKQKKVNLSFAAVIVLFVILAVSLGVPLSLKRAEVVPASLVLRTNAPSQSNAPSIAPSSSPTTVASDKPSDTPSYSPSACVNQISSNAKKIDLQIDDPFNPIVAVDGKDMVVVVQQDDWFGPVFIIFYTLANGGWERINIFQEDGLEEHTSVALSGNTAFVGFWAANDWDGAVSIYEKDQYGVWNLMENPFVHDGNATRDGFGLHVDIDRDLACVVEWGGGDTYLYHQENNKWVQVDMIDGEYMCSIAGDTIAIGGWNSDLGYHLQLYRYNQQLNGVVSIQDPIPMGSISSLDLSNDYLVYWDYDEKDAFVYRREETNQTYTFLQRLNISGPEDNYGLALDNDIVVVAGNDKTHIFSEQTNGKWEETITLDQPYSSYALSGRSLVATSYHNEVYFFDIEGCSQAMPTQTPSLSAAPSDSPSSSPTLLQCIEIAITHDQRPDQTSWYLERVVGDGGDNELVKSYQGSEGDTSFVESLDDYELVKSHSGSEGDTSYVESLCLQEGEYIFTIYDYSAGFNGICCDFGEGNYNVTNYNVTSNGMLIVEGGEFWFESYEETVFSIPFDPSS